MSVMTSASRRLSKSKRGEPAWDIARLFPPQGQWTEEDYLALADRTNWLIELSDGFLEVLPMATPFHQRIVQFLFEALRVFILGKNCGEVFTAPLPVQLWSDKMRDPDILFVRPGRIRDAHRPPRGADLVMEVVSEGEENRQRDLEIKPVEYARAKVAEYWIVDPEKEKITVLRLAGKRYRVHGEFRRGEGASSVLLSGFSVRVSDVLDAGTKATR
jgi:Uma2 family endonuclease